MRRIFIIANLWISGYAWCALPPPSAAFTALPQPAVFRDWEKQPLYPIPKAKGEPVADFILEHKQAAHHPHAVTLRNFEPTYSSEMTVHLLPAPSHLPMPPQALSLYEAIALALRGNPAVKTSELQRVLDKFGLELIAKTYRVQWDPFTLSATLQNRVRPTWSTGVGASLTATTGTNVSVTQTNNLLGGPGSTTVKLTQPLLKGYGIAVNGISYKNGLDSERVNRLTFKNSIITVVVSVIKAYRSLVASYNSLEVSQQSFKNQETSVFQTQLQVKAGEMAPADLLQQQANLESTQLSVVQQENTLRDAYQSFLSSLGLAPSANILIDRKIQTEKQSIPTLADCIQIALKNNIAYQTALIQLKITQRALITAKNARKWTLNATSSVTFGAQRSAVVSPIASLGTNPTLALSLSAPIDDIASKQGVESAKIAIENSKLNIEQQKEQLIRQVINQWQAIQNQGKQVRIAAKGVELQSKTLMNTKLKLEYGRSSTFELTSLETSLLSQQVNLVNAKITYLNNITDLYQTMGITLDKWHIKLSY